MGSGGHNKNHRTIENFRRVDSFGLRRLVERSEGSPWTAIGGGAIYCDLVAGTVEIAQGGVYQPLKLDKAGGSDETPTRLYFRCPRCDRRVRYLYSYHDYHVCRNCLNADYMSQQRNRGLEAIRRKMRKVVEQDLGYTQWRADNPNRGISELGFIPKPRYMRWAEYGRLMQKYWDLQDAYTRQFLKICGAFLPAGWEKEFADLL